MTRKHDPERYERMCVPFDTEADAQAAIDRFNEGLDRLREECRIQEVILVCAVGAKPKEPDPDKEKVDMIAVSMQFGNSEAAPELALMAYDRWVGPVIERAERMARPAGRAKPA